MKLEFLTVQDLLLCRKDILPIVQENKSSKDATDGYKAYEGIDEEEISSSNDDITKFIEDLREYDVPFYERTLMDNNIRVANWYSVKEKDGLYSLTHLVEKIGRPKTKVLAFDIETTKLPLRFPNPEFDTVMMISYMIDGQGYLIINREIVSKDIDDFEYTPKPELYGPFICFNEKNELNTLNRFVEHIKETKPNIFVTFNGDFFDWPFLEKRASILGIPLYKSIGLSYSKKDEFYTTRYAPHLDVFNWVKRDSYLPQGSQGLKAVTKAKLGYNPLEIDPELMVPYSIERPIEMAQYSVSDAVATYYLYMKYVHPFIFSLCSIIPMNPDDVLRKGTGTLCESLLMVEALNEGIIFPNKYNSQFGKMYDGHVIESETYIGGHVEALSTGVYRSDIPIEFNIDKNVLIKMKENIGNVLKFFVEEESKQSIDDIVNLNDVKEEIIKQLDTFIEREDNVELPLIYHVDVAAMYPNIILTNRLQPSAIVDSRICSSCVYNSDENNCKRKMEWDWRVEYYLSDRSEFEQVKSQLEMELHKKEEPFPSNSGARRFDSNKYNNQPEKENRVTFNRLSEPERIVKIKSRLKEYCKTVYKKTTETKVVKKTETICMREHPFYVETVRAFRDRRYIFRTKAKEWGKILDDIKQGNETETSLDDANDMVILYDSLQLAHKCILNSFYGYVMRKGARWYSMEMAGIVTQTGSSIIKMSREIVEGIGRVLELDTDGIWCCIPKSFPNNFTLTTKTGKKLFLSYICSSLNTLIHSAFTNTQYQTKDKNTKHKYHSSKECTIFFEVDGPYKAMFLPTSTEEGKQLKKRYAIFDFNDRLVELKGFELKRRGELKVIKDFQSQIFGSYLKGSNLEELYQHSADVANHYLDIIDTRGQKMGDEELIELISESRSMSKSIHEYGNKKSTAITTSKRLAELLGDNSLQVKGLTCKFIISSKPEGKQVAERAIPVELFKSDAVVQRRFLRKWTNDNSIEDVDIRDIVDWNYYKTRLSTQFQKVIVIPSFFQGVKNPLPRVPYPDWLNKKLKSTSDGKKQLKISDFLSYIPKTNEDEESDDERGIKDPEEGLADEDIGDIEDIVPVSSKKVKNVLTVTKMKKRELEEELAESTIQTQELIPDPKTQPVEWLQYQKKKWRKMTEERKRRKRELGANASLYSRPSNSVDSLLNRLNLSMLTESWQILQIKKTRDMGILKVWFVTGRDSIHSTYIKMDRKFYVNSYVEKDGSKKSHNILPRMRQSFNLYEISVDEEVYQMNRKMIDIQKSSPDIEGLYESQVSLEFRALLELGCMCSVRETAKGHDLSKPWSLSQLKRVQPNAKQVYMKFKPRLLFLYQTNPTTRSLIGIYDSIHEKMIIIYVATRDQDDISKALSKMKILEDYYEKKKTGNDEVKPIEFEVVRKNNFENACKHANNVLNKIAESYKHSLLLFTQTLLPLDEISCKIKVIDDIASVQIAYHKKDSELTPINWLLRSAAIFTQRALAVEKWYERTLHLSRYAEVPIGNMETDYALFLSDVFYSRKLKENNNIIWYSDSMKPDLGGNEEDDFYFSMDLTNPERCFPDCVDNISIDIDLQGLAINTIIQSSNIADLDPSLSMIDNPHQNTNENALLQSYVDETTSCALSFKILKQLVTGWLHDSAYGISASNLFVDSVYRWLSSVHSKLYDPALHKLVHRLIKKVFIQLLSEFRKLGSKIIYASFNRIIIATEKRTLKDGIGYFEFLKETLKSIRLFSFLDFNNPKFYQVLLFKDIHNFVAVEATQDIHGERKEIIPKSVLRMVDYLPASIRDHFKLITWGAVIEIYNQKMRELRTGNVFEDSEEEQMEIEEITNTDFTETQKINLSENDAAIVKYITDKLFLVTKDANRTLSSLDMKNEMENLKHRIHPALTYMYPSLEFVKACCYMLSLKKSITLNIGVMKRELLKTLDVQEFSKEAEFQDPIVSYVLSNVICGYCNDCRDLDLLRDPNLVNNLWKCPRCDSTYDKDLIEQRLVDIVQKKMLSYQTQDIYCTRCSNIKSENLSEICMHCSSELKNKEDKDQLIFELQVFNNIANFHDMKWLLDAVHFALNTVKESTK